MATITLRGNPVSTSGELPAIGSVVPGFKLVGLDLADVTPATFAGKRKVLNIFPSIDTPTCAMSVRQFNQRAAALANTVVLCISADLPFAQKRFCGAEGVSNMQTLSDVHNNSFGQSYGVLIEGLPLKLLSRAVFVVDGSGKITYVEYVPEVASEPKYEPALAVLKAAAS